MKTDKYEMRYGNYSGFLLDGFRFEFGLSTFKEGANHFADHSKRSGRSSVFRTAKLACTEPITGTSARTIQRAMPPDSLRIPSMPGMRSAKFFNSPKNSRALSSAVLSSSC